MPFDWRLDVKIYLLLLRYFFYTFTEIKRFFIVKFYLFKKSCLILKLRLRNIINCVDGSDYFILCDCRLQFFSGKFIFFIIFLFSMASTHRSWGRSCTLLWVQVLRWTWDLQRYYRFLHLRTQTVQIPTSPYFCVSWLVLSSL